MCLLKAALVAGGYNKMAGQPLQSIMHAALSHYYYSGRVTQAQHPHSGRTGTLAKQCCLLVLHVCSSLTGMYALRSAPNARAAAAQACMCFGPRLVRFG